MGEVVKDTWMRTVEKKFWLLNDQIKKEMLAPMKRLVWRSMMKHKGGDVVINAES